MSVSCPYNSTVILKVNKNIGPELTKLVQYRCTGTDYMRSKNIDWDAIFLQMATVLADASHCVSYKVGALIVKDNHIIASGVNNTPGDMVKCDEIFPAKSNPEFNRKKHHAFSEKNEVHAEMDAFGALMRGGGCHDLHGATLYCTLQPCDNCLKNILQYGIRRIVFAQEYDYSKYSAVMQKTLKQMGVELIQKPIKRRRPRRRTTK